MKLEIGNVKTLIAAGIVTAGLLVCPPEVFADTNNMLVYYNFDYQSETVRDLVGCNTGTVNSAAWTANGKTNGAYTFTAAGQAVYAASDPGFNFGSGDFSLCLWVYPYSNTYYGFWLDRWVGGDLSWTLRQSNECFRLAIWSGSQEEYCSSNCLTANEWQHIGVIRSGSTLSMYRNGTNVGSSAITSTVQSSSASLYIGNHQNNTIYPANGVIDEVMIFNRALSSNEITWVQTFHREYYYPRWWYDRGLVDTNAPYKGDYRLLAAGQLKWVVSNAMDELDASLPGGAGSDIAGLVAGFTNKQNNLDVVNEGQLKNTAAHFYDRINEVYSNRVVYPWTLAQDDDHDYLPALIGRMKTLFSFDRNNSWMLRGLTNATYPPEGCDWTAAMLFPNYPSQSLASGVVNSVNLNIDLENRQYWERFYLSSSITGPGGWGETGAEIRIINGAITITNNLPSDDSLDITDAVGGGGNITIQLCHPTNGIFYLSKPMYYLRWNSSGVQFCPDYESHEHYLAISNGGAFEVKLTSSPPNNNGNNPVRLALEDVESSLEWYGSSGSEYIELTGSYQYANEGSFNVTGVVVGADSIQGYKATTAGGQVDSPFYAKVFNVSVTDLPRLGTCPQCWNPPGLYGDLCYDLVDTSFSKAGDVTITVNEVAVFEGQQCGGSYTQDVSDSSITSSVWITTSWRHSNLCQNNMGDPIYQTASVSNFLTATCRPPETITIGPISILDNTRCLGAGQSVRLAVEKDPDTRIVIWSIVSTDPGELGAFVHIDPNTGELSCLENMGSLQGRVLVRAEDTEQPTCFAQTNVNVGGCCACSDCAAGSSTMDNSSVEVSLSLGKDSHGLNAGSLQLTANLPSAALSTPAALTVNSLSDELVTVSQSGAVRQVKAPECLADLVTSNACMYSASFYKIGDIETYMTNGLYVPKAGKSPYVVYIISNPSGDPEDYDILRIVKAYSSTTVTNEYAWTEEAGVSTWTLTSGNGLRVESKSEEVSGSTKTVIRTIEDTAEHVASKVQETYYTFDWGSALTQSITDPDDTALTTTYSYHSDAGSTGSYGRIYYTINPDGSWLKYDYDSTGRITRVMTPFKDAATNAADAEAVAEYRSYTPVDDNDTGDIYKSSPRTVTNTVLGVVVAKTFYAYYTNEANDAVTVMEKCANATNAYGAAGNERTTTLTHESGTSAASSGKLRMQTGSDGKTVSNTYEFGTFTTNANPALNSFAAGAGSHIRTTSTHGTTNHPTGIAWRTTRDVDITDGLGREVYRETYIYDGTNYHRVDWSSITRDDLGHVVAEHSSDGTYSESTWGCCGKEWDKDRNGTETEYSYDALNRLDIVTKDAATNILTTSILDAEGRTLSETRSAGGLSLSASNRYDLAGRTTNSFDNAGLLTVQSYASGGRVNTVTQPGGGTTVTTNYLDGRTKSVSGTAVTATTHDYGVNADGTLWSTVYTGPNGTNSAMWTKTTTDALGRTVRTEWPGFGGVTITNAYTYNEKGQQIKVTTTGQADTLFEYDELGAQISSGLDLDNDGHLDTNGTDRVSGSETLYDHDGTDYHRVTISRVYATDNSGTATTTGIQRVWLTGLSTGMTSKTVSLDVYGNAVTNTTSVDRSAKTVRQETKYPDSTNSAVTVSVNGLMTSTTSKTGIEMTFGYDALERQIAVTDPRTGASVTHYDNKGRVDYVVDSATNRTSFVYAPDTGRRLAVSNALNEVVRYDYDVKGQMLKTWGDTTYPVSYAFDEYGRMTNMATYRGGTGWTGTTWPTGTVGTADYTTWKFDEATGLLTNKLYADTNGVVYTYTADGKLETRKWARGITTTYHYHSGSGAMTNIDYSDSTPDVFFTLDRIGRQVTVTDGQGTRTFTYNDYLQLATETNDLGLITRQYDGLGRNSGLAFNSDYSVNYVYSDMGRFGSISSSVHSVTSVVNYSYLANSDLIAGWSNGTMSVVKSYEANRNLLLGVDNKTNGATISKFEYQNDVLGRRTQRIDTAVGGTSTNTFVYNSRSELTNALMNTNAFGYSFDSIGNRISSSNNADELTYLVNALNQYTNISDGVTILPVHDADGNLTNYGAFAFTWDGENRLIGVVSNGSAIATYSYDYQSRRIQKVVGSVTNKFAYDGWAMIQETSSTGATNTFVYGLDLSGSLQGAGTIGGLLYGNFSGTNAFYFADGNGNVTELATTNGSVLAHYEYDPYGNTVTRSGSLSEVNPWKFQTEYYDRETGNYYWKRRYYHPDEGRFLSRDPIEEDGGILLYGYCGNEPIGMFDAYGLEWKISRFKYKWAAARMDAADDTFQTLASKLPFEYEEREKWLAKEWDGKGEPTFVTKDDVPKPSCTYYVPNTVVITYGSAKTIQDRGAVYFAMQKLQADFEEKNYLVENEPPKDWSISFTPDKIKTQLQRKELAVWAHAGQGNEGKDSKGEILLEGNPVEVAEGDWRRNERTSFHTANEFTPIHKLSTVVMYICMGRKGGWKSFVATGGKLYASDGIVFSDPANPKAWDKLPTE